MNFSKLSSNEKLATYGAVALVILGVISNWGGLMWLSVLAGLAALVVIFLPQLSPGTNLPGSKGTLLVTLGGIAAAGAVIELLRFLNYFFRTLGDYQTLAFAVALVGALVLAWAGWQEFQAEGGKFSFGSDGAPAAGSTAPPPAPAEPMPPSEPMSPPMSDQGAASTPSEPMGSGEGDDRA